MFLNVAGLPTATAMKVVDQTYDRQLEHVKTMPEHKRAIATFKEKIGNIETVDQFINDRDVYTFVMKAFDLEDQIFGRALMKRVLEGDINDKSALVNRLTDPKIRALYQAMDFRLEGSTNTNTFRKSWQDDMVDRYVERQVINGHMQGSGIVGEILEFRKKIDNVDTWFDVFKDRQLYAFMRTSLGMPDSIVKMDLDRKVNIFENKFPIADLKDPKEVRKLERQFTTMMDVKNGTSMQGIPILQLLNTGPMRSGQFNLVTIDIGMISSRPKFPFR
jgi:hypothetical protein